MVMACETISNVTMQVELIKSTPHNSGTSARVLYKMRNMILQTLYRMFDEEMDGFKPASSP
jgi:hypothetical protein